MNTPRELKWLAISVIGISLALAALDGMSGRGASAADPNVCAVNTSLEATSANNVPATYADLLAVGLTVASTAR